REVQLIGVRHAHLAPIDRKHLGGFFLHEIRLHDERSYSSRRACIGSICDARRAGRYVAPMVVRISNKETATNGLIPGFPRLMKEVEAMARQARMPITRPTATPAIPRTNPCFKIILETFFRS